MIFEIGDVSEATGADVDAFTMLTDVVQDVLMGEDNELEEVTMLGDVVLDGLTTRWTGVDECREVEDVEIELAWSDARAPEEVVLPVRHLAMEMCYTRGFLNRSMDEGHSLRMSKQMMQ